MFLFRRKDDRNKKNVGKTSKKDNASQETTELLDEIANLRNEIQNLSSPKVSEAQTAFLTELALIQNGLKQNEFASEDAPLKMLNLHARVVEYQCGLMRQRFLEMEKEANKKHSLAPTPSAGRK